MDPDTTELLAPVDATDPLVVVLAWGLTWAAGRWVPGLRSTYRGALPAVAVLLALALRSGVVALQGQPFTWEALLRAVSAGALAVLAHSQVREVQKAMGRQAGKRASTDASTEPPAAKRG